MPEQDAQVGIAQRTRGLHILGVFFHHDGAAHQARVARPSHQPHGQVHIADAGPQHRHDGDDEHDDGEGHHYIHKAHEKRVQNAAEIGREQADERTNDERDAGGRQADDKVIPGAPDDAGENIPPQLVGAPDMLCRRRGEHGREVLVCGGLACDEPRKQRREHHAKQDQAPCGERKVAAKHVPYGAPLRCFYSFCLHLCASFTAA